MFFVFLLDFYLQGLKRWNYQYSFGHETTNLIYERIFYVCTMYKCIQTNYTIHSKELQFRKPAQIFVQYKQASHSASGFTGHLRSGYFNFSYYIGLYEDSVPYHFPVFFKNSKQRGYFVLI